METDAIADNLISGRCRSVDLPRSSGPGIYTLFLRQADGLPPLSVGPSAVLYVGITENDLGVRNHFVHRHSGFSTVRRSLGALLKHPLQLVAIPRAPGPSKTNVTSYRFTDEGEAALSAWMADHLDVAQVPVSGPLRTIEKDMIVRFEPPLNLTGWRNPQRGLIRQLRAHCRDEATRHRR